MNTFIKLTELFRKAKLYHPDVNPSPDANAEFLKVRDSFRALNNPKKRHVYDKQLFAGY
jgi:DnaJ-class molecular chaperone